MKVANNGENFEIRYFGGLYTLSGSLQCLQASNIAEIGFFSFLFFSFFLFAAELMVSQFLKRVLIRLWILIMPSVIYHLSQRRHIWGLSCWNTGSGLIMAWLLIFYIKAVLCLHRRCLCVRGCLKKFYYCSMPLTSNAPLPSIVTESKLIYCKG